MIAQINMEQPSRYSYTGPIDHTIAPDKSLLRDKSVVITGGANGKSPLVLIHTETLAYCT
jgi:hypothetical protein